MRSHAHNIICVKSLSHFSAENKNGSTPPNRPLDVVLSLGQKMMKEDRASYPRVTFYKKRDNIASEHRALSEMLKEDRTMSKEEAFKMRTAYIDVEKKIREEKREKQGDFMSQKDFHQMLFEERMLNNEKEKLANERMVVEAKERRREFEERLMVRQMSFENRLKILEEKNDLLKHQDRYRPCCTCCTWFVFLLVVAVLGGMLIYHNQFKELEVITNGSSAFFVVVVIALMLGFGGATAFPHIGDIWKHKVENCFLHCSHHVL